MICVVELYSDVYDHIFKCSVYLIVQSKTTDLRGTIHYEAEDWRQMPQNITTGKLMWNLTQLQIYNNERPGVTTRTANQPVTVKCIDHFLVPPTSCPQVPVAGWPTGNHRNWVGLGTELMGWRRVALQSVPECHGAAAASRSTPGQWQAALWSIPGWQWAASQSIVRQWHGPYRRPGLGTLHMHDFMH